MIQRFKFPVVCLFPFFMFCGSAIAETVATCGESSGYAVYHHEGLVPRDSAGFRKDEITGAKVTLISNEKGYDLLVVDAMRNIKSMVDEGGKIILLRRGPRDVTFAHINEAIELYTFYRERDGSLRYDLVQSKGGGAPIHKSSVLRGNCNMISFELIK